MCGICGIADWRGNPIDPGTVVRMWELMGTRGPDDAGLHIEPGVGLGHRRLSIIHLSAAGHQPMASEDRTVWVLLNGEIYNCPGLRPKPASTGDHFASAADTEVLVHGYDQQGIGGLVERLLGIFAFAVWDRRCRVLLFVHDAQVLRRLFYHFVNGRLVSQIRT